jgi:G2/mitotic-specific cyclin 3/4
MFYSGYTWRQMYPAILILLDCLSHPHAHAAIYTKYVEKKFKCASRFVEEYMSQGKYTEMTEENPQVLE